MIDFSAESYVPNEIAKSFTHVCFLLKSDIKMNCSLFYLQINV